MDGNVRDGKKLEMVGVAGKNYPTAKQAIDDTYTTRDGENVSTNLTPNENLFSVDILASKNILDVGCGIGRNLKWIMENTEAHYHGLDPNESMLNFFWQVQDNKWKDRVSLYKDFSTFPNIKFDTVVVTFVFQHIGYRTAEHQMNIDDITREIRKYTHSGTVWFIFEHSGEETDWISRWLENNDINPQVFIKGYKGLEELTHRDWLVDGGHHLLIWKERK